MKFYTLTVRTFCHFVHVQTVWCLPDLKRTFLLNSWVMRSVGECCNVRFFLVTFCAFSCPLLLLLLLLPLHAEVDLGSWLENLLKELEAAHPSSLFQWVTSGGGCPVWGLYFLLPWLPQNVFSFVVPGPDTTVGRRVPCSSCLLLSSSSRCALPPCRPPMSLVTPSVPEWKKNFRSYRVSCPVVLSWWCEESATEENKGREKQKREKERGREREKEREGGREGGR